MRPRADTVLAWTGAACTSGCPTCPIDAATAPAGIEADELQRRLVGLDPGQLVVLVGGEPLLRPDFLRLVAVVRAAGGVPGVVTTGRPLLYPQLRARLRRAQVGYLRIQCFGTGAAHDRATAVPGGFAQLVDGVRAWCAEDDGQCDVDLALSLRGGVPDSLAADLAVLADAVAHPAVQLLLAVDPDAPPDTAASLARDVLAAWGNGAGRPLLVHEAPASDADDVVSDAAGLTLPPPRPHFVGPVPPACCLGSSDGLAHAAAPPPAVVRANSFNFISTGAVVARVDDAAACGAWAAGHRDPGRELWLVDGERLVHYATDSGDFSAAEIAQVKDAWSHLFLDRAAPGVLDDFTEGMRRVLPDPVCTPCAQRERCGRRHQVVGGAPFAHEEAWIAAFVGRLRGRVLDVGCGEMLYRDVLAPLVASRTVDYTGLDPDPVSLAALREVMPAGRFLLGGIETFSGMPASYDHVLCLRSLNHVLDLPGAIARMAALLRPGGTLLIVECTPFAMLREATQVAAADRAPRAGHQHYRNVASTAVLPLARRYGLRVVEHRPAARATTNEWILLLAR